MSETSTRDQTASRTGRWADLANPTRFLALADRLVPWLAGGSAVILALGLYLSFTAPEDYQHGHYGAHHVYPRAVRVALDAVLLADGGFARWARWSGATRWPMLR